MKQASKKKRFLKSFLIVVSCFLAILLIFVAGEYQQRKAVFLLNHSRMALENRNLPLQMMKDNLVYSLIPFPYDEKKLQNAGMPVYELEIGRKSMEVLHRQCEMLLSHESISGDASDIPREYVPAKFTSEEKAIDVEVKLRGRWDNHFMREHPSLRVKFPGDCLFNRKKQINLSIPMDKRPIADMVVNNEMRRQGFMTLESRFVLEKVNGKTVGVFQEIEQPGRAMVDRNRRMEGLIISGAGQVFGPEDAPGSDRAMKSFRVIQKCLYESVCDWPEIREVIDLEMFAGATAMTALLSSRHGWGPDNLRLYYDPARERFEPFPWDYIFFDIRDKKHPVFRHAFLQFSEFRNLHEEKLKHLIENRLDTMCREGEAIAEKHIRDLKTARPPGLKSLLFIDFIMPGFKNRRSAWNEDALQDQLSLFQKTIRNNASFLSERLEKQNDETLTSTPSRIHPFADGVHVKDATVIFGPGRIELKKSIEVPRGYSVVFSPGLDLAIYPDVTIVVNGDFKSGAPGVEPVVISGRNGFGGIAVYGKRNEKAKVSIENTEFYGGAGGNNGRRAFDAAFFAVDADVKIVDTLFSGAGAEDAVNIVYSMVEISDSKIEKTTGDALDLDFCTGSVAGLDIQSAGGDGIDMSGSKMLLKNTRISGCGDKGVSAGENSVVEIINCEISTAGMGVASKDGTELIMRDSVIELAETGIGVYRKKLTFPEPSAWLERVDLKQVKNRIHKSPGVSLDIR